MPISTSHKDATACQPVSSVVDSITISALGTACACIIGALRMERYNTAFQRQCVCVHELFEQQAAAAPQAECLAFEGARMTFANVNYRANQLARHLFTLDVQKDIPVAILMERSFDLIIAMMGACSSSSGFHQAYTLPAHYRSVRLCICMLIVAELFWCLP